MAGIYNNNSCSVNINLSNIDEGRVRRKQLHVIVLILSPLILSTSFVHIHYYVFIHLSSLLSIYIWIRCSCWYKCIYRNTTTSVVFRTVAVKVS